MPKINPISMGLGKATMRGIRRCPECGTINGSKGNVCKNKACNAVFRDSGKRKKLLAETCRLDTGTFTRVYSVRVRDKGPDYRGFVQLPVVQTPLGESSDLLQSAALCFVDHCQGSFNTKVLQCHEQRSEDRSGVCQHISAALRCSAEATPLSVNTSVLEALTINPAVKQEVWGLISVTSGPAVQRVSRDVMAVKCRVSSKFPLGYLHVTFAAGRSESDLQFACLCSTFKESALAGVSEGRCPHFYACICAFIDQQPLRTEFDSYIRLEVSLAFPGPGDEALIAATEEQEREQDASDLATFLDCHVEILQDSMSAILSDVAADGAILADSMQASGILSEGGSDAAILSERDSSGAGILADQGDGEVSGRDQVSAILDVDGDCVLTLETPLIRDAIVFSTEEIEEGSDLTLGADLTTSMSPQSNTPLQNEACHLEQEIRLKQFKQIMPLFIDPPPPVQPTPKNKSGTSRPQMSFVEWLGTVTESINQQMHYQFAGRPMPLVFHTPTKFFDKLKERMYRSRKKRLTSTVTIFTRRESVPVGTFVKHSWSLTSRFHVKAVFDTPQMPLRLVRSFVRNVDGTFTPADQSSLAATPLYKTYLRVGLHRGEAEPSVFKLEWVPDVLPVSNIGELRIHFEFGHVPQIS